MSRIAALIVAGGSGSRLGGMPKQYRLLGGVPIIRRSIEAFRLHPAISKVQAVIGAKHSREFEAALTGTPTAPAVIGGDTRQESARRGLTALAEDHLDFVLIHDAARPLVSRSLINSVVAKLKDGAEAVLPLLPIADSLRQWAGEIVGAGVPRDGVCRAQTPQGFRFASIHAAHEHHAGDNATDDIALAERAGMKIVGVMGEEANLKITTAADMALAERLLRGASDVRTGSGYDVHRFVAGNHVWLCGVRIPHTHGLEGHSDADVGLHALTDAILGALAAGDIGQHFPPSDPKWKGTTSRAFLAHAAELVSQRNGVVLHCDVTVICEAPKIGPHREAMRATIAESLQLDVGRVSVKATTTEGLGFTGRGEGLAAQATATIRLPS